MKKVYENALVHELRRSSLDVYQQMPIEIHYDDIIAGQYVADSVVEAQVLVELKATEMLSENHVAQCLNYLKATRLPVCLLLNFGRPRLEIRRLVGPQFHKIPGAEV